MRAFSFFFAAAALCAASPAWSASVILTDAVGRECYEATLLMPDIVNARTALQRCNRAVDDPDVDHVGALVNRSDVNVRQGRFKEAVDDAREALSASPNFAPAQLNLGAGLLGMKRYQEAVDAINRAIALGVDKQHIAYLNRGMAREGMDDIQGAYQDYKHSQDLEPDFAPAAKQLSRFRVVTTPASGHS